MLLCGNLPFKKENNILLGFLCSIMRMRKYVYLFSKLSRPSLIEETRCSITCLQIKIPVYSKPVRLDFGHRPAFSSDLVLESPGMAATQPMIMAKTALDFIVHENSCQKLKSGQDSRK